MARVSKEDLRGLARMLSDLHPGDEYRIQFAYGRQRLIRKSGAGWTDISPSLSSGALLEWIWAFQAGMETCRRKTGRRDI